MIQQPYIRDVRLTVRQFREILPVDVIIRLQKDLSQARFSYRIILQIEFVKALERVHVSVHVESINRQVICRQIEGLEDLFESEPGIIAKYYNILQSIAKYGFSEPGISDEVMYDLGTTLHL